MPLPAVNFTSSAVKLLNPSYVQAHYVHPQLAGNPPEPLYMQPHTPMNNHQLPLVAADQPYSQPQATSADQYSCSYTAPPSLNVQSAAPSFPYLIRDDPRQFSLLKMALTNILPHDESEQFKYHVLLDHLKLDTDTLLRPMHIIHFLTPGLC